MRKIIKIICLSLILAAGFLLLLFSTANDSLTTDESVHLGAGYTYLKNHDFRFDPEHPLLIKELAVAPMMFMKINQPAQYPQLWEKSTNFFYDSWQESRAYGEELIFNRTNDYGQIIFWSRFLMILITLGAAIFVYFWAQKLYGVSAGFLAAALFLFNPIVLAHGRLINTDLAAAFTFALAIFTYWKMLNKASWQNILWAGLALGLAALVKFTFVILIPIYIFLFILNLVKNKQSKVGAGKFFLSGAIMLAVAYLMILVVYIPKLTTPPKVASITQTVSHLKGLDYQNSLIDKTYNFIRPIAIPKDYFKGLVIVLTHVNNGNDAYLLGHYSKTGWWYYFPVALAIKTPLAMIILLGILKIYLIKRKSWQITDWVFAGAILIYLVAAMVSKADLGVRHLLPIYPLLAIWISQIITKEISFKYKDIIVGGLLVWFFAIPLFAYPNYLSYFNELTGGSKNGYKYLSDSNLDWGQDMIRLDKFMDQKNLDKVYLDYTWLSDEAIYAYGLNFERITPEQQNNLHGYVAIGAGKIKQYEPLRARATETYQIENSLFVFKVD